MWISWQWFCILVDAVPYRTRQDLEIPSEELKSESIENQGGKNDNSNSQESEEAKTRKQKDETIDISEEDVDNNYVDFIGNILSSEKYLTSLEDNQDYYVAGPIKNDIVYDDDTASAEKQAAEIPDDSNNDENNNQRQDKFGKQIKGRGFFGDMFTSVKNAAKSALSFFTGGSSGPAEPLPEETNSSQYNTSGPLFFTGSQLMKMRKDKRPIWERLKDGPVSGVTVNGQTFTFTRGSDYVPPKEQSYFGGTYRYSSGVSNGFGMPLARVDDDTPTTVSTSEDGSNGTSTDANNDDDSSTTAPTTESTDDADTATTESSDDESTTSGDSAGCTWLCNSEDSGTTEKANEETTETNTEVEVTSEAAGGEDGTTESPDSTTEASPEEDTTTEAPIE
ncbi:hypothetical protein Fcan01_06731 [Folsomia candida]|uniref:Uncharacterized protein n=1 Tax=Folsomia candida TaxID=158441 RepID=A0A226EN99_FOLCA|nr:hypothetical protein Fcan01_06731 [Folsomia candida]